MSAVCSVILHSVLFYILGSANGINDFVSMFVGDVLGTLLVLYALRTLLVWGGRWREKVGGLQ
jgi:NhaP-type Na+/H+ or K+/H+ antiporter